MKKGPICPLLRKPCVEHDCMWWTHITGQNPQTGAQMDHFDCSIKWLPVMMVEASKQARHIQGAVESMRNETVERQDIANSHMATLVNAPNPFAQMIDAVSKQALPKPVDQTCTAIDHIPEG